MSDRVCTIGMGLDGSAILNTSRAGTGNRLAGKTFNVGRTDTGSTEGFNNGNRLNNQGMGVDRMVKNSIHYDIVGMHTVSRGKICRSVINNPQDYISCRVVAKPRGDTGHCMVGDA